MLNVEGLIVGDGYEANSIDTLDHNFNFIEGRFYPFIGLIGAHIWLLILFGDNDRFYDRLG